VAANQSHYETAQGLRWPVYCKQRRWSPGIGSKIETGEGVIGVAARERVPFRIGRMAVDYIFGAAIRNRSQSQGMNWF